MKNCKIIIKDETNCKITGLELNTRKRLTNKFKYEIPGARFTPAVRLGRWDGTKTFCQLGGSTYINLLPEILPLLDEEGYYVELEDLREYNNSFDLGDVQEDSYSHINWPDGHTLAGQPIMLRDYQVDAINTFLGNTQSIQQLATGAGKTIVSAVLSHKCEPYGRTVIIVPNTDLIRQTEADYKNLGLDVGVFYGGRKEYTKTHTICTWQSLNSLFKKTKAGEAQIPFSDFIDGVVCVMVDEAHGLKADALLSMMTGVMAHIPIRWAFTGTIPKEEFEFRALQVSVGEVIGRVAASDLQEKGVLSNCHINIVQMLETVEYKDYQAELKYLLSSPDRLMFMSKIIVEASKTGNTLVLVDRIQCGETLAALIPGAVFVNGQTKSDDRKEQYASINTGENTITIATFGVAAVGINVPRIFNLFIIEPGKSFVRVIQSIGRGLRKAADKDHVEIFDVCSSAKFSKRHLTARKKFYQEANYNYTVEKVDYKSLVGK